ncbi:MAG: sulfotransferase family protein [Nitrospinales bacterium]
MIIGVQKAGTSSLHYYLNQHPRLIGSIPKEIHYFDKWINYGYSLEWYENHFKSFNKKSMLFFESSPNYVYSKSVIKKIYRYYPNIKLILILRNPIDRAYSAWNMYYNLLKNGIDFKSQMGSEPEKPNYIYEHLIKGREKFADFRETLKIESALINTNISEPAIIRRGIYIAQIKNILKFFKRDQLLIVNFDKLIRTPQMELDNIYRFLNINPNSNKLHAFPERNKRLYESPMSKEDRTFLEKFYIKYDHELFEFLKSEPYWKY